MYILDIFKTNQRKLAEQNTLIAEQAKKLQGLADDNSEGERKLAELKQKHIAQEDKIHDLGKQIDKIESKKNIKIAEMDADRKMHDEKMEHLVKIKIESLEIEHDKKVVALERSEATAIAKVKDEYRDKSEERLEKRNEELKGMYSEVLERLPNLNASMHLGGKKDADKSDNG